MELLYIILTRENLDNISQKKDKTLTKELKDIYTSYNVYIDDRKITITDKNKHDMHMPDYSCEISKVGKRYKELSEIKRC